MSTGSPLRDRRAVTVLSVVDPSIWSELPDLSDVTALIDDRRREVRDERAVLARLGDRALVRYHRRTALEQAAHEGDVARAIAALPPATRRVLHAAQRHAQGGVVVGRMAWDPDVDAAHVRMLHGGGYFEALADDDAAPYAGRYQLAGDLPPPSDPPYDFEAAAMDETDDLSAPKVGPIGLLHDLASLAASLDAVTCKRIAAGSIAKLDGKRLGKRLGDETLAADGDVEAHPRWARALRGLDALGAVETEPMSREVHLVPGLEDVLAGTEAEACDRLVHRLVDADLHVALPAVRAALKAAGRGAVDEVVFLDELKNQHREVIFPRYRRDGRDVYPTFGDEDGRPFDDVGWETVETRMLGALLSRVERFGLVRRAPGVFAATADGRVWAGVEAGPQPPVWVTGDLELVVPPGGVTPWERFQLERLGRCLQRDTVDRYRIERASLARWLAFHDVDEAVALLRRRAPGVPPVVVDTLVGWARSAERVVVTRGVLDVGPSD